MTKHGVNFNLGSCVSDNNQQKLKPVPEFSCFSCPVFLSFSSKFLIAFGKFSFQKHETIQLFSLEFCEVLQDDIFFAKAMKKLISARNIVFVS